MTARPLTSCPTCPQTSPRKSRPILRPSSADRESEYSRDSYLSGSSREYVDRRSSLKPTAASSVVLLSAVASGRPPATPVGYSYLQSMSLISSRELTKQYPGVTAL